VTDLVRGGTLTDAWFYAVEQLRAGGREAFDLVVGIADPEPDAAQPEIITALDTLLVSIGCQDTRTVANTIFPASLARTSPARQHLYERYQRLLPMLHRNPKNTKGTYFERLIGYPLHAGSGAVNQLEIIIHDLGKELDRKRRGQGPMRHMYEAQIFAPGKDRRPWGFPCMSSLSFHLDGDQLRLSATYRNQYYMQKALGNFVGLAALQHFVADAVGLRQGALTVHAFHAEIETRLTLTEVDALIEECRAIAPERLRRRSA
jgi:hypothetical protein